MVVEVEGLERRDEISLCSRKDILSHSPHLSEAESEDLEIRVSLNKGRSVGLDIPHRIEKHGALAGALRCL